MSDSHPSSSGVDDNGWPSTQDRQITAALDALDRGFDDSSPVERLWALTSEFISDKHVLNVHSIKRRAEQFRLLDLGCGTGALLSRLAGQFPQASLYGVDPNEPSVIRARARAIPRCSCDALPFDRVEGAFDVVICSEVFEHVEASDLLLDKLGDLVARGGYLSISTPSGWMFRTPRLGNVYRAMVNPRRFWRLYLRPERNWSDAIRIHPAILPSKLRRKLEARGFTLISRQSALWWFHERGVAQWFFRRWGTGRAALAFFHFNVLMDAGMNFVPLLRCGETRVVLLMRRR